MRNYRIVELVLGTGEVRYKVQREHRTLFGKIKWQTYDEATDEYDTDSWVSSERGGCYSSLLDAKNIIAGFRRNELRKIIKSERVLTNEEIDSCC